MIFQLFAANVPVSERSRAFGYLISAGTVGQTLSALLTPHIYWPWMFYKFGIAGIIWTYFWFHFYYRSFDESRVAKLNIISSLETGQAAGGTGPEIEEPLIVSTSNIANNSRTISSRHWLQFVTFWPLWAIYIAHFAMNWSNYIIMQWFPYYLSKYLGADSKSLSMTAVPYIMNSVAGIGKLLVRLIHC